jgi:hypothetical protein
MKKAQSRVKACVLETVRLNETSLSLPIEPSPDPEADIRKNI